VFLSKDRKVVQVCKCRNVFRRKGRFHHFLDIQNVLSAFLVIITNNVIIIIIIIITTIIGSPAVLSPYQGS